MQSWMQGWPCLTTKASPNLDVGASTVQCIYQLRTFGSLWTVPLALLNSFPRSTTRSFQWISPLLCKPCIHPSLLPIANFPLTITDRPSKRKSSPESDQPLSEKRGKHPQSSTPVIGGGRKTAHTSAVVTTPAPIQDVSSVIEEFTDVMVESPATKRRVSEVKSRALLEETSVITTPGRTDASSRSKPSVVRPKSSATTATAKQSAARKKTAKAKPELVTPTEFARRLQEQADSLPAPQVSDVDSRKARESSAKLPVRAVQPPQYLRDHVIFYTGGDLTYASARTRGCMNYVRASTSSLM
jgi:hypothetical protein